ncbi:MAG: siphovirus Gp157 family protein, partial [Bryobacteraceae bacterium]
ALLEYVEAFGYKVDRIANYIKAQKVEAETAAREAQRLTARQKAAENREKRLKSMLVYYMNARELRQLRGALNTITLQRNSQPSLIVTDEARIPSAFFRATAELAWTEWEAILASLPPGALLERLRAVQGRLVQKELLRGVLADALGRGETIEGAALVKGQHVRIR